MSTPSIYPFVRDEHKQLREDLLLQLARLDKRPLPPPKVPEHDPTGKSLHDKGAKADAGKPRPSLIFRDMARALWAVVEIATAGAAKYTDGGWIEVPNAGERYDDAALRHMLKRYMGQERDADSQSLHLAHEAWNALAKLELHLRATETSPHAK